MKIVLATLKEAQRCYKVHHGVVHASKLYPQSPCIIIAVGVAKGENTAVRMLSLAIETLAGAGGGIVKVVEQLIRGVWVPTGHEILRPTL